MAQLKPAIHGDFKVYVYEDLLHDAVRIECVIPPMQKFIPNELSWTSWKSDADEIPVAFKTETISSVSVAVFVSMEALYYDKFQAVYEALWKGEWEHPVLSKKEIIATIMHKLIIADEAQKYPILGAMTKGSPMIANPLADAPAYTNEQLEKMKASWKLYLESEEKENKQLTQGGWINDWGVETTPVYEGQRLHETLPALREYVKHPVTKNRDSLQRVIIDLNDTWKWPREKVADWLDTLDLDLRFPDVSE